MDRSGRRRAFEPRAAALEERALLSARLRAILPHPIAALDPANQHKPFVNLSNFRRSTASSVTHRVNQAFQAFAYHVLNRPITLTGTPGPFGGEAMGGSSGNQSAAGPFGGVPIGTRVVPITLQGDVGQLNAQVATALATIELDTRRVQRSVSHGPKFTPRAQDALIPFAQGRINQVGAFLAANPPKFDAQGHLLNTVDLDVVNAAYDAILDAIAENAVHPELFLAPGDFYNNPATHFTLSFGGDPVGGGPGFYTHGPGGVPLRAH